MKELSVWERIREAVLALGGKATYREIIDYLNRDTPGIDPKMIQITIIGCTVNHGSRIHYTSKRERFADKPYDFLYQPRSRVGYVEWYDPARHGVWGNLRGEDGKLRVARFDLAQVASGPVCIPSIPIGTSRSKGRKIERKRARRTDSRLERLIEGLKGRLDLTGSFDLAFYPAYQSLPLCILASIFHLSPKGEGKESVVSSYCRYFSLKEKREDPYTLPPEEEQESVSVFLEKAGRLGVEAFARDVLGNLAKASARSQKFMAESAVRFARVLRTHKTEFLQDVPSVQGRVTFENAVMSIPGLQSGLEVRYFYRLAGCAELPKVDRLTRRFLIEQIGENLSQEEAGRLLEDVVARLKTEYPQMTPAILERQIGLYKMEQLAGVQG